MANTIKQKRGTTDPGASDLVVGELAINTTDGGVFTKTDGGTVVEIGGGGGASEINDLSDAVTNSSGSTIGLGANALENDDGTSNNNTALGRYALQSTTSGAGNAAGGYAALDGNTTGIYNSAWGENALDSNTTGSYNVGIGRYAGGTNTTKNNNTSIGASAGYGSTGTENVYIGANSGYTSGLRNRNVVVGSTAGYAMTTGSDNVILGEDAAHSGTNNLTTGSNNIIIGGRAAASSATVSNEITLGNASITSLRIPGLQSGASNGDVLTYNSTNGNITLAAASGGGGASEINGLSDAVTKDSGVTIGLGTGALANDDDSDNNNTALGYNALNANTSGSENTALGYKALEACTSGGHNTCLGQQAGDSVTTAFLNTYVGSRCGRNNTTSSNNTGVGFMALEQLTTGQSNTAIGQRAGDSITTGVNNTCLGNDADVSSATVSNEVTLGNSSVTKLRVPGIDLEAESGVLNIKNGGTQSEVRWYCESSNAHYAAIKAPAHSDFSGNITFTLPGTTGSNGQVLSTNGSGVLSWVSQTGSYSNSDVDSHLNQSNPTSGYVLSWNGSDYAWVAPSSGGSGGISNLVEDTTPQLGGNLDMQTHNITGTGTITATSVASSATGMRKITTSTSSPSGGSDGDIWIKYTA